MTIARVIRNLSTRGVSIFSKVLSDALLVSDSATATYVPAAGSSSWSARSTATGVTMATKFATVAEVENYLHEDGTEDRAFRRTDDPVVGSYMRLSIPASQASATAQWRRGLNDAWVTNGQGFDGAPYYIQFRARFGPNRVHGIAAGSSGHKICNIAGYLPSSPNSSDSNYASEIVLQNTYLTGVVDCYRNRLGAGSQPFYLDDSFTSPERLENAVDNGAGISDPDARFCRDVGLQQPSSGCWLMPENEWVTFYIRVEIPTFGGATGAGNKFDIWVAEEGETTFRHLHSYTDFGISPDDTAKYPKGQNGLWLLSYETARTSASFNTWVDYSEVIVSTQPIAIPAADGAADPTWMATITDKTWRSDIVSNTPSAGGAPEAIITAYSGGAVDQKGRRFMINGGGHSDSENNGIYGVDFSQNTPAWATFLASNGDAIDTGDFSQNGSGLYANGAMRSTHTYSRHVYANDMLILTGLDSMYGSSGNWTTAMFSAANATSAWTARGKMDATPPSGGSNFRLIGGSSAYDPKKDRIWALPQFAGTGEGLYEVTPSAIAGNWAVTIHNLSHNIGYSWSVVIPHMRLLVVGGGSSGLVRLNLDNVSAGFVSCSTSGSVQVVPNDTGQNMGAVYDEISHAIFLWQSNGANIRKIAVPQTASGTWATSTVSPAGANAVTPSTGQTEGTFTRWNIIEHSRSGRRFLVLINAYDQVTYVYAIPRLGM